MNNFVRGIRDFFKVMIYPQAYINLVYSLSSFPLGLFYFVILLTGLALGLSLVVVWVGVPILLLVVVASLVMANFERFLAVHLCKEYIPKFNFPTDLSGDVTGSIKKYLQNPVFWKSPIYLFLKFPLGLASFILLVTFLSVTAAMLTLPIFYDTVEVIGPGIFFGNDIVWRIDSIQDAILGSVIGLFMWPITLHVANWMTWIQAKFW